MAEQDNIREYARKELERHGIPEREDLYDPKTGRTIPQVSTGVMPFYRAAQMAPLKAKARSTGGYTAEGTPQRSGPESGKHLGLPEYKAMKSHGADAVLSDLKLISSSKNSDFWNAVKAGRTPNLPNTPPTYQRFRDMIRAAGVNLREDREGDHIYAMTNRDAKNITGNRKIERPSTYDMNMRPIRGGLMDPDRVGGKFSYIELPEKMLNPIMEQPVKKILGLTNKEMDQVISGEKPPSLQERLKKLNLDEEMYKAKQDMASKSRDKRDRAYKKYGYLNAMKDQDVRPEDFMMERVPIVPSEWRDISQMDDNYLVPDPNKLYRDLMFKIRDYEDAKESFPELLPQARDEMYNAYRAAIGTAQSRSPKLQQENVKGILQQFLGKGSPKASSIQRRVIGSDIDLYGLGVITPDPKLGMDEAGIPEKQAWKVYEPFTIRNLVKKGMSPRKATEEVEEHTDRAKKALEEEVGRRPAILNRAPTLHKYGVQAFDGKLVPGSAIRTNPYVIASAGGDYDGNCCDFDTELELKISKSELYYSPEGAEWFHKLQNVRKENNMLDRDEEVDLVTCSIKIGEFPRVSTPRKDKKGADVYDVPDGVYIPTCDKEGKVRLSQITKFTVEEDCPTVKVKTYRGREVIVSDNESLTVFNPDTDELNKKSPYGSIDHYVPVVRKIPVTGKNYDFDIGWLYGSLISDGWTTERTVGYAKLDQCKREEVVRVAREKITPNFTVRGPYNRKSGEGGGVGQGQKIHLNGDLSKYLPSFYSDGGRGSLYKKIPEEILSEGCYDSLLGLVSGLLDGDACITWNNYMKNKRLVIAFYTSSEELVKSFRRLFMRLGVRLNVTENPPRNNSKRSYVINPSISDLFNEGILHKVCLVDKETQNILNEYCQRDYVKDDTDKIIIDSKTVNRIKRFITSKSKMSTTLQKACKEGVITRDSARKLFDNELYGDILHEDGVERLKHRVEDRSVTWDKVKSIEDTGKRQVFDFEVPETKIFALLNGLVIYDTMSLTTPATDIAAREARDKMYPSKNLLDPKGKPPFVPDNEMIQGLWLMTKDPKQGAAPVKTNKQEAEQTAKKAYKQHGVDIDTPVIGGDLPQNNNSGKSG